MKLHVFACEELESSRFVELILILIFGDKKLDMT